MGKLTVTHELHQTDDLESAEEQLGSGGGSGVVLGHGALFAAPHHH